MSEIVPATTALKALVVWEGHAALFDDPDSLLVMEPARLRELATSVGRSGGSVFAQVRRAAGLVAWAGWHRFNSTDYEEFVAGLASDLGIGVQALRKWRTAVVTSEHLAVPALAEAKKRTQKGRSEAVRDTAVSSASAPVVIPATSTEVVRDPDPTPSDAPTTPVERPDGPAGDGGQEGAAVRPGTDGTPETTSNSRGVELADALTDPVPLPSIEDARLDLLPCPFCGLCADDGPLTAAKEVAQVLGLLFNFVPTEFFATMTEAQQEDLRKFIGGMNPEKRRSGTISRPEDRKAAKAEAVAIDPANCTHPRSARKQLAYGNFCGDCKVKVA